MARSAVCARLPRNEFPDEARESVFNTTSWFLSANARAHRRPTERWSESDDGLLFSIESNSITSVIRGDEERAPARWFSCGSNEKSKSTQPNRRYSSNQTTPNARALVSIFPYPGMFLSPKMETKNHHLMSCWRSMSNISTRLFEIPPLPDRARGWKGSEAFSNQRRILSQPSARPDARSFVCVRACLSKFHFFSYNFLNSFRWMWKPVFLLNLSLRLLLLTFFTRALTVCVKKRKKYNKKSQEEDSFL